jgi:hypothetical protein
MYGNGGNSNGSGRGPMNGLRNQATEYQPINLVKLTVVSCKDKKGSGYVGCLELGGKLYKIEPSIAEKDGVSLGTAMVCKKRSC